MASWQVQQAKSRLSELLEKVETEGPQTITKHGVDAAIVLSINEYQRLTASPPRNIIDVLLGGPKYDDDDLPDFSRQRDMPRDLDGLFEDE